MAIEQRKTNCHFCGYLCAFTATVEDGRITAVEPDPTRYPYDPQVLAGCRRWPMNLEVLDGADRVNRPLRRVAGTERGAGAWEEVSWDEALDDIAARLEALRAEHGPGTLASMIGGPHTSFWPLHRFMTLFGSPNNMGIGQICWNPRIWMDVLTFGWTVEADITDETGCVVIWGTNPAESDNSLFWRTLLRIGRSEVPLVVIDPRYTRTAAAADIWLAPRPGTDCALALGMLNVIIAEGLADDAFVGEWCHGFDELAAHVAPWTPEAVAAECGVDADDIRRVARLFAGPYPSALVSGRGIDQVGRSVAPTHRAICCLRAITGNVDRPGACVLAEGSDFTPEVDLELTLEHAGELAARSLNTGVTPLQSYDGYARVAALTERLGRKLPARYLTSAHPDLVLRAMETGEPYPVRALIVEATNPLLTYADTHRVFDALMGLDLIVALDYYLTPTASIADFVLPAAGAMERPTFQAHGGVANIAYGGPAACAPYYERKVDYDVFRELGLRLGQADEWPEETFEDAIAATLAPAGMDWDAYCELGLYHQPPAYAKHLLPGPDGAPQGFATATGRIELASEALDALGGPRLPEPGEPRRLCSDAFVAEREAAGWTHLPLITGARKQPYNASMYFNNEAFRTRHPYPVAEVSEATAAALGLSAGDTVVLATDHGEARFVLATIRMRDGLINADYGWWHPEWAAGAPAFGGMWESNVNCLTSCTVEEGEPMIGTWSYNAVDCMVRADDRPLTWQPGFTPDPAGR
ncbi:molybdopterin-containing oxidoreductase family protein [Adlercreutzia faecimuris]|uniref:Molybdopterin-dependent oxidoreductase n=1 Tax=Adlercreutzia faecimuris TaxID=2897341 RepID=A0ABS9WFH8_9ACTN|nr:molybdopterin-dependent oxidoreductase [Adlercreutzia sp. JBNU-10]MCI2241619.1 molybdopterin-dependent oxidoreductase [Adlercreutzia sp. JBNU-10]